jgi:SAM-dependent methyltransferase
VRRSRCENSGSATPGHSLEDLTSGRKPAVQWNAASSEILNATPDKTTWKPTKCWRRGTPGSSSAGTRHLRAFHRFRPLSSGAPAFFRGSSHLRPGSRVLDAGCGTGAATLAVHDAFVSRGITPGIFHAFDLTPAMLQRFRETLETLNIAVVEVRQANVLNMVALPAAWANYDLIVTASMLEYVPRERLSDALAALRTRLADSGRLVVFIRGETG